MLDLGRQIQMPEQLEQTNLREIICPAATWSKQNTLILTAGNIE